MKIFHLIGLALLPLYLSVAAPIAPKRVVEVNGIRFTGVLIRTTPILDISGVYNVVIMAENVGKKEQTLLLGEKPSVDSFQGFVMQTILPERDRDGKYLKPVLSDQRPITLKPGERAKILSLAIMLPEEKNAPIYDPERKVLTYWFEIRPEMQQFYDVWIGEAELQLSLFGPSEEQKKEEATAEPTPKPEPGPKVIKNIDIPWSEPADDWSKSQAK